MNVTILLLAVLGLVVLIGGAEWLVRGAARLAESMGIKPLVIGLTVVAFGTSAPELAVCLRAALAGQPEIAIGNAVGSNIANVLLILGLSALIAPLAVSARLIRLDVPLMIAASALLYVMALNGRISRPDGLLLFCGIIGYTAFSIVKSRQESAAVQAEYAEEYGATGKTSNLVNVGMVVVGLALLILGARWLVDGAVMFARVFGVSELVIGLTVVAIGTSLPELAASIVAALRDQRDIAVGNVVGSNLFNILMVLGLTGAVSPAGVPVSEQAIRFDIPVMLATAVACLPIFFTGYRIGRWEGALFVAYYAAYTTYLVLAAMQDQALDAFGTAMLWFALPLTAVTLAVFTVRSLTARSTDC